MAFLVRLVFCWVLDDIFLITNKINFLSEFSCVVGEGVFTTPQKDTKIIIPIWEIVL